ncbi:MAG: hypothetical protein KBC96_09460 [Armatimonadetes bacterium]|nr:hypothetical protein [Armatimonadota bacterium]
MSDSSSSCCKCGCSDPASKTICCLVLGCDERAKGFMPGWDVELARQKLLFFTTPSDFARRFNDATGCLSTAFQSADLQARKKCISFLLGVTDSLASVVELRHNLQSAALHGDQCLSDDAVAKVRGEGAKLLAEWEAAAPDAARLALDEIKLEDLAVNKGDNIFIAWAKDWQKLTGADPYASIAEHLKCFAALYQPKNYYVKLFLAWERGDTRTQFFNDYGMQAARCRKIGSLGGTTNPAIAVMGEDDLDAKGNIHGEEAAAFITRFPNKWKAVRAVIARDQKARNEADDWGATKFTEWVVVDAMLALRPVFLMRGLGRVAFQLRPDWHDQEEKCVRAGGEIYAVLGERVRQFDDILLEGAGEPYVSKAAPRVGKANNHFKVSCTGPVALNVVRAFNAGYHPDFPDALKERMFTNMTLSYEVPQMVATWCAVNEGIRQWEKRNGEKADDGLGGSVITSMIGRFNDAIRVYRVEQLLNSLPQDSPFRSEIKPAAVKSLDAPPLNSEEFKSAVEQAGIEFDPEGEEDAISRAGTLCTKRAARWIEFKYGSLQNRLLTASKRAVHQNTDLLDVPFSTDFGNIQAMYVRKMKRDRPQIKSWTTLEDGIDSQGFPLAGTVWHLRHQTLRRIWPAWDDAFHEDGVLPSEYINTIYVPPTLNQFLGFWADNVARAKAAREALG